MSRPNGVKTVLEAIEAHGCTTAVKTITLRFNFSHLRFNGIVTYVCSPYYKNCADWFLISRCMIVPRNKSFRFMKVRSKILKFIFCGNNDINCESDLFTKEMDTMSKVWKKSIKIFADFQNAFHADNKFNRFNHICIACVIYIWTQYKIFFQLFWNSK